MLLVDRPHQKPHQDKDLLEAREKALRVNDTNNNDASSFELDHELFDEEEVIALESDGSDLDSDDDAFPLQAIDRRIGDSKPASQSIDYGFMGKTELLSESESNACLSEEDFVVKKKAHKKSVKTSLRNPKPQNSSSSLAIKNLKCGLVCSELLSEVQVND